MESERLGVGSERDDHVDTRQSLKHGAMDMTDDAR